MAFTCLCMAGMFVLLGAETIAAFQVLIYVGAITVLILYGVMFTKFSDSPRALFFQKQTPIAAVLVAAVAIPVALFSFTFTSAPPRPGGGDLPALATSVFTDFAFPFEVASVLLRAAMVGAIVLTRRDDPEEAAMRRVDDGPLGAYVAVSAVLSHRCAGVLTRRNAVVILMCVELMLTRRTSRSWPSRGSTARSTSAAACSSSSFSS